MHDRVYVSPPDVGSGELRFVRDAIESNWVAPLGPHVDGFEEELAGVCDRVGAVALSSGTAAIHLSLLLAGVGPGDVVLCPTLTFVASVNPVRYVGATPVLVDVAADTWVIDVDAVEHDLEERARQGRLPKALISVDLYGQCPDYQRIERLCSEYEITLIEDAAEALGSIAHGRPAGAFGRFGILSFNGNKIVTTSGGGALLSDDEAALERARFLATQARDPAPHYEHSEIGFNYRMSNIVAAIGRAQLVSLDERVGARRRNFKAYQEGLGESPGIGFMPEAPHCRSNRWLTTLTIDPAAFGADRERVRLALEAENIESRPVWKPMHLQPLYRDAEMVGGEVAARLFEQGLCLPSGSNLDPADLGRIIRIIQGLRS